MLSESGVYRIRNLDNNKCYVGSAAKLYVRFTKHLSQLRRGKHHSRHLQASWALHGEDAFVFEVLQLCGRDALVSVEQWWIDNSPSEFNVSPTAGSTLGVPCSDSKRAKLSKAHTGKVHPHRRRLYPYRGAYLSLYDIAEQSGLPPGLLRTRLKAGMSAEVAVACGTVDPRKADPERRAAWLAVSKQAAQNRVYRPKSAAGAARQRTAVIAYNKTREITDAHRKKAADAQRNSPRVERFEFRGERLTVLDLSERFGMDRHVLRKRINAGWPMEEVVSRPVARKPRR